MFFDAEMHQFVGGLLWLGVLPVWRRRGFARLVVARAMEWILRYPVVSVQVQAIAMAMDLYQSIGFLCLGDLQLLSLQ